MRIHIDPSASEPIYEQIRVGIAEAIVAGDLEPGEPLPSIRALARDLRVSVITTTRAYNELVSDGLVVPQQGRGVFVRDHPTGALQDRARARIREALDDAVRTARITGIDAQDLHTMLDERLHSDAGTDHSAAAGPAATSGPTGTAGHAATSGPTARQDPSATDQETP